MPSSVCVCLCGFWLDMLMNPPLVCGFTLAIIVLKLLGGNSTYLRSDIYLTGSQAPVRKLILSLTLTLTVARGQWCVCVCVVCFYVHFSHACLSVSWGCGVCAVEEHLADCHVPTQQVEKGFDLCLTFLHPLPIPG